MTPKDIDILVKCLREEAEKLDNEHQITASLTDKRSAKWNYAKGRYDQLQDMILTLNTIRILSGAK